MTREVHAHGRILRGVGSKPTQETEAIVTQPSLRDRVTTNRPAPSGRTAPDGASEAFIDFEIGEDPERVSVDVAWSRVMRFCRALTKGSTARVTGKDGKLLYSYKYRGIDDVISLAGTAFRLFGIIVTPTEIKAQHRVGNPTWCMVDVTYTVKSLGTGNGTIVGVSAGEALDFGDKALTKALTQAYRVYLTTALTLPTYDPSMDSDATPIVRPEPPSPEALRDEMLDPKTSLQRMKAIYAELQRDATLGEKVVRVGERSETLLALNLRIGKERKAAAADSGVPTVDGSTDG